MVEAALRSDSGLPSGTVTFLFTDIEGSTGRWERQPEAMGVALARHDALLRTTLGEYGGHVFKTVGDAFCAAFVRAPDAVAAAAEAQNRLLAEPWGEIGTMRVRMALHTGAAEERDGDYFGPPLNRVARLLSAGHGGQILLSQVTYELVRDALPTGTGLADLGEHRLKDLIRPERIFQLAGADLSADFPPLRTLDARPNNLPLQATPLLGREHEIIAARQRLLQPDVRLLTLTGPGGTGKTRLSLQLAAELIDQFADGVFFVELGSITDPGLVPTAIAEVLDIHDLGSRSVLDSMKAYLRDRTVLLVLDNFEQLTSAAPVVAELLGAGSGLKVLVTSRAPLELRGEYELSVPPLALPDPARLPRFDTLSQYGAVALFIERAAAIRPDFAVTSENARALAEICVRLDGLPLAIELAAARIRLLNPQTMLARLERRLPLLTGGARDLPARQQTLHGAIAWSYDLLDETEQALFRRLGVFVGGCTLEAAEAVCDPDEELGGLVLDGLASLIAKNLLRQEEGPDGEIRFTMLATIHEYATEQLAVSGERPRLQAGHLDYYLSLAETAWPEFRGPRQAVWFDRLEREHDNLRAALEWSSAEGRIDLVRLNQAIRLADALKFFWVLRGWVRANLSHILTLVGLAPAGTATRARALTIAANLHVMANESQTALPLADEGLRLWRTLDDPRGIAVALERRGRIAAGNGDHALAMTLLTEARDRFRELGSDADVENPVAILLANVAMAQGDSERALTLYQELLAEARAQGDGHAMASALRGLARLRRADWSLDQTLALLSESLTLLVPLSDILCVGECLENLAGVLAEHGRMADAAVLFGASDALRERMGRLPLAPSQPRQPAYERHTAQGDAAFTTAWAAGRALSFDQAVTYAREVLTGGGGS